MILPSYRQSPSRKTWRFEVREVTPQNLAGKIIHKSPYVYLTKDAARNAAKDYMEKNNLL